MGFQTNFGFFGFFGVEPPPQNLIKAYNLSILVLKMSGGIGGRRRGGIGGGGGWY